MTFKETNNYIKKLKNFTKKVTATKKEAKNFLEKTGIYTKKGKLNKNYK